MYMLDKKFNNKKGKKNPDLVKKYFHSTQINCIQLYICDIVKEIFS